MKLPHTRPGVWPEVAAGKLAAHVARELGDGGVAGPSGEPRPVALLGLPDDTGIALNHGRVGAADGPTAFRAALAAYGTPFDAGRGRALDVEVVDVGDVVPAAGTGADALYETHRRVTEAVRAVHDAGLLPVCMGGGHDLTLPSVRALAGHVVAHGAASGGGEASGPGSTDPAAPLGGVNVDAHLDVREREGSGMPFRRLIEDGHLDAARFATFGAARFVHAAEHVAWLTGKGGTLIGVDDARRDPGALDRAFSIAFGNDPTLQGTGRATAPGFVSVDLDALDGAYAPAVSAVNPSGLDVATVTTLVERAGRTPGVGHLDLMELSPPHDVDGRTARVAVLLFLHFLAGLSERESLAEPSP